LCRERLGMKCDLHAKHKPKILGSSSTWRGWRWTPSSWGPELLHGSQRLSRGRQVFAEQPIVQGLAYNTGIVSPKSNQILPIHKPEQLIALLSFEMKLVRLACLVVVAVLPDRISSTGGTFVGSKDSVKHHSSPSSFLGKYPSCWLVC